jgi:hypothetical protein
MIERNILAMIKVEILAESGHNFVTQSLEKARNGLYPNPQSFLDEISDCTRAVIGKQELHPKLFDYEIRQIRDEQH